METSTSPKAPERQAIVRLPTWESHAFTQTIVGRVSPVSSDLEEYRGIPYGTVRARWEHSHLRTRLPRDVFDATKNGPKCPQPSAPNTSRTYQAYLPFPDDVTESEFDCLNLFVIRPSIAALEKAGLDPSRSPLPVLVWIHGGGFGFGAGTDPMWDPSRLVLRALQRGKPVIAVCVNYRLNLFGFGASSDILATQDHADIKGLNFGLRDQKVALSWITHNIPFFGGDPAKITIGGQSAGAVAVSAHLLEAEAEAESKRRETALFRKAIMQSGALGTLGPITLEEADSAWWDRLCNYWSVDAESSERRVELLRRVPADALVQSAGDLGFVAFPVVADGITVSNPIQPGHVAERGGTTSVSLGPVHLHTERARTPQRPVGVLMGVTDSEASIFANSPIPWAQVESAFTTAYSDPGLRSEVMQAYGLVQSASEQDLRQAVIRFISESIFDLPVHLLRKSLTERRRSARNAEDDTGVHSFHVAFGNPFPGPHQGTAHHCVELIYLFKAFEDALAKADVGLAAAYQDPGKHGVLSAAGQDSDSGLGTPSTEQGGCIPPEAIDYQRTNIELCDALQGLWLDFIVDDDSPPVKSPDEIVVFGKDRSTRIDSLVDDPVWKEKLQKWEILAKDFESVVRAGRALREVS